MSREVGLDILNRAIANGIQLRVLHGRVRAKFACMPDPETLRLIRAHEQDVLEYLTTPPPYDPERNCINGHPYEWVQRNDGRWICACYFRPLSITVDTVNHDLHDTWLN